MPRESTEMFIEDLGKVESGDDVGGREKISRFIAHFDPAKLGNQLAERHHG